MHPVRKGRLQVVLFILVFSSLAIGLVAYGLRGNINLFFPPQEIAAGKAPVGQPIRLGGMVVEGSVRRSGDSLRVEFDVTDYKATVTAVYDGILPDLFAEGQGVVAAGVLDENWLRPHAAIPQALRAAPNKPRSAEDRQLELAFSFYTSTDS